ncbi:MAG: T9SS C-terminal target domain-containing protein, partial [Chitinophagia bacterium]|nr:T9SS C-terminal target domain-containing protein [Chitinophagia bacterium]
DGGPATAAKFNGVFSVALDRDGNMYVVDGLNSRIRKIDTGRVVSTFAGGSTAGFSGDGGAATAASLSYPTGIATDTAGNVYIADLGNNRVRKVDCILPRITPIISSVTSLCEASVTTFLDSTLGGVWTTTNGHAYVSGGLVQGVSQGVDTVIYTVANHCGAVSVSRAITINPLPHAGPVLGSALICGVGDTTQLSDTVSGGTWLLTNTNATITTGGLVTGNRLGADTVRYIVTNGCGRDTAWGIITISPLPDAGVITGIPSICGVGNATNLSDTTAGGAWTNVAPTVATVSGGTVWGINYGTDTIKYTVGNACGLATVGVPITVYHTYVSAIWGADTVCAGYHTSLYDSIAGGNWRSTLRRTVVAATGVVTGVSVGIDTIHYTLTNPCGVYDTFFVVQVRPAENCWPLHTSTLSGAITSFGVIPNPSDGNIRLQIPMPDQEQANLTITDLLGRTVFRGAVRNGAEINTSILAGTYVLMVSTPTGTYVERIVIR